MSSDGKIKLCLAIPQPIGRAGGVETLVRELVKLGESRYSLYLASEDDLESATGCLEESELQGHFMVEGGLSGSWRGRFIEWLRSEGVQLVHFHSPGSYGWLGWTWNRSPILDVCRAGIATVETNHQMVTPWDANRAHQPWFSRYAGFLKRWPGKCRTMAQVGREVFVSAHDMALAARLYPLARGNRTQIYHSRIDLPEAPADLPRSCEILSLAGVCRRKGQAVLVEAFAMIAAEFPEWKLRLVGPHLEMPVVDGIRKRVGELGLEARVSMEGPSVEPFLELERCEIYVQPSLLEALGLSVQEAMAMGRPCVGSRVGGIPELIDDGTTGILVAPGDTHALAAALRELIKNRPIREKAGRAGWHTLAEKGMTRQGMLEAYDRLYHSVLRS